MFSPSSFLISWNARSVYSGVLIRATAASLLLLSCQGCATIARGSSQKVMVISDPPGAKVMINRDSKKPVEGVTPCELRIPRLSRPVSMEISLDGREAFDGELVPATNSGIIMFAALELVLFIIPGMVDLASGAAYEWPREIHAALPAKGEGQPKLRFIRGRPPDADEARQFRSTYSSKR